MTTARETLTVAAAATTTTTTTSALNGHSRVITRAFGPSIQPGCLRDGVHLVGDLLSSPPSRGGAGPRRNPEHNRRWSPTNAHTVTVTAASLACDGTPGCSLSAAVRAILRCGLGELPLCVWVLERTRVSGRDGFIDRLNRRNSVDNNGGGGPGATHLPHVATPGRRFRPGNGRGGLIARVSQVGRRRATHPFVLCGPTLPGPKGGACRGGGR